MYYFAMKVVPMHLSSIIVAVMTLLCLSLFFPHSHVAAQILKKATILPQWEPQAQFAGIFMAKAKGFYERRGVDMTVLRGGPSRPPGLLIARGEADFGTMFLTTAVKLVSQGEDIVNLTQIVHRSALLLVAKKSDGIERLEDLQGRRISTWGPEFSLQLLELLNKNGLRVQVVPQSFTVDLFLRGAVDAVSAMWYNEYHTLLNSGIDADELTVFSMADCGMSFPEDGLYCLRSTWERDPELCCAVAQATMEGWKYAFEHQDETLDVVMERVNSANLPTNRVHQRWMLARMRDVIAPGGEVRTGELAREEFQAVTKAMLDARLIGSTPDYEDFHAQCANAR